MVLGSSLSSLEHGKILKKGVQSEKSTSAEAGGPRRFDPWVRGVWLLNRLLQPEARYYNQKPYTATGPGFAQNPKPPYHNQPTSLHFAWFPI